MISTHGNDVPGSPIATFTYTRLLKHPRVTVMINDENRMVILKCHGGRDGRLYGAETSEPITELELLEAAGSVAEIAGHAVYLVCCHASAVGPTLERGLEIFPPVHDEPGELHVYHGAQDATGHRTAKVFTKDRLNARIRGLDAARRARQPARAAR